MLSQNPTSSYVLPDVLTVVRRACAVGPSNPSSWYVRRYVRRHTRTTVTRAFNDTTYDRSISHGRGKNRQRVRMSRGRGLWMRPRRTPLMHSTVRGAIAAGRASWITIERRSITSSCFTNPYYESALRNLTYIACGCVYVCAREHMRVYGERNKINVSSDLLAILSVYWCRRSAAIYRVYILRQTMEEIETRFEGRSNIRITVKSVFFPSCISYFSREISLFLLLLRYYFMMSSAEWKNVAQHIFRALALIRVLQNANYFTFCHFISSTSWYFYFRMRLRELDHRKLTYALTFYSVHTNLRVVTLLRSLKESRLSYATLIFRSYVQDANQPHPSSARIYIHEKACIYINAIFRHVATQMRSEKLR